MHELSGPELYHALEYAKSINEETGVKIMQRFQLEQTAMAETIFGIFPSQNDMDLGWLEKQAVLLDAELQSLIKERDMDDKIRAKLQDRFVKRAIEDMPQMGLANFMNEAIDDFASESPSRVSAIQVTQTMVFIVIRLFSNLYSHARK